MTKWIAGATNKAPWLTLSNITNLDENTLSVSFGFDPKWKNGYTWTDGKKWTLTGVRISWSHWYDHDSPTSSYNPELSTGIDTVSVEQFSGGEGNAQYNLETQDVEVWVWVSPQWKVKDGDNEEESNGAWVGPAKWVASTDSWPRLPSGNITERLLDDLVLEIWADNIQPDKPEGLRYANTVGYELYRTNEKGENKLFKRDEVVVWDPSRNEIHTTAHFVIDLERGGEYQYRLTSYRYGNGRKPFEGKRYQAVDENGNKDAWTDWHPSGWEGIQTPPKIITLDKVEAKTATSVMLHWTGNGACKTYKIVYAERKEWLEQESNARTEISDIYDQDYIVTGLESGKQYFFSVCGVNDAGDGPFSNVRSVIIGRKPDAPTTWSSTTTASLGRKVYLFWKHNSEDNSIQQLAEVSISVNGGTPKIFTYTTPNTGQDEEDIDPPSSHLINTSDYKDGATITWKVRTAGVTKEYGPWSIERTVDIFAPPTLRLNGDTTLTSFPYEIELEAGPKNQKVISFSLSIYSTSKYADFDPTGSEIYIGAQQEVFSFYYDPDPNNPEETENLKWDPTNMQLNVKLNPENINLSNAQTYVVKANVCMSTGLTLDEDVTYSFTVNWIENMDGVLIATAYINRNNITAQISASYEVDGVYDRNVTLAYYRRTYDGNYLELEKGVSNVGNATVVDPHPPLDYANYRIVATSKKTGAVMFYDLGPIKVGEIFAVIQWDEAWPEYYQKYTGPGMAIQPEWQGTMLKLPWNLDIADKWSPQTSAVEYIGREHPVGYYGTQVGSTSNWKIDVVKADREMVAKLRRLATYKGNVYVREPYGSGYWAMVKVSFSQNHTNLVVPVTLDITRVEGGV